MFVKMADVLGRGFVAPLAGSVDRNANASNIEKLVGSGRSPRGERG